MNREQLLKLQAYLDGELSSGESKQVAEWLAHDEQVRAVYEELRATRSLLLRNEMELKLPESREFYWSKIEREIRRLEPAPSRGATAPLIRHWLIRLVAPLAGAAAAIALFISVLGPQYGSGGGAAYFQEIETPLEEASAISFHSQKAGMRVVWIQSQDVSSLPTPIPDSESLLDDND